MKRVYLNGAVVFAISCAGLVALGQPTVAGEHAPPPDRKAAAAPGVDDPLEKLNRVTSEFNAAVRDAVLDPLVSGYKAVTPQPMQEAISNAVSNLSEPVTVGSSLLQGDGDNATTATKRFIINTTVGFGGTQDRASEMGLKQRKEDLGQAFAIGGVEPGPHIVLPIIGPSNLRDAAGDAITALVNPLPVAAKAASSGVNYSNNQDDIKALTAGALDAYVVERDAYEQNRRYEVNNGALPLFDLPVLAEDDKEQKKTR